MGSTAYGMGYFLPQFIKAWGLSNFATGWTVAVPETIGIIGMLIWGCLSIESATAAAAACRLH